MLRPLNVTRPAGRICGMSRMGARASEISTSGDYPNLLLNDIAAGDPVDCEYSTEILSEPAVGTFVRDEYGQYVYTPPPDYTGYVGGTQRIRKYSASGLIDTYVEDYGWQLGNAVSSDLTAAYSIGGSVTSDLASTYGVSAFVSADLGGTYTVNNTSLQLVTSDLTGTYAVKALVSASLAATYQIESIVVFARAPAGDGYAPRRQEQGQYRPAAIQQDLR